jgi:hypothetical protein
MRHPLVPSLILVLAQSAAARTVTAAVERVPGHGSNVINVNVYTLPKARGVTRQNKT